MNRRCLLGTVGFALAGAALGGCLGAPRADGGGPTRITDRSLRATGGCDDPESATVDATGTAVRIRGCITGPNGCSVPRLGSATIEGDDGRETLTVVVTTETDAPPETACTQALVQRGYEVTVDDAGAGPETIRVVHDAAGGRRQVASVDRGS
jgi:hypothetical protein